MSDQQPPDNESPSASGPGDGEVGGGAIEAIEIQTEMEQSFLDYAMSVIVSRALPDARDGLKPVHRRILWAMSEGGVRPDRGHVKCATVVGDVIGKYHPHGDSAIYDALVRMGQSFSLRDTLIDPHGNFGSPSDPPAAYRYTECRLSTIAMQLLEGIDEQTVDFVTNFDGRHVEPQVLPSRFPNLLVNGSQGIAVGMATNIPPHNLGEVIDAVVYLLDRPDAGTDELMQIVKGPDFPTGGLILGRIGIGDAYRTGRGSIKLRAVAEIEEGPRNSRIVVTEIPYQTSIEAIEQKTADLVNDKIIDGIRGVTNESAKGNTRLVFELKRDSPALITLNLLYKHTPLQTNFAVNMVALVDGVPRTMGLRDLLVSYVDHQIEVIRRRSEYRLERAQARAHILEGLIKAIDMIDAIIALIRRSEDRAGARAGLMGNGFEFSEVQANHILDMALGRLTRLGRTELDAELAEKRMVIAELELILGDDAKLRAVIREELSEVRNEFASERRSQFTHDPGEFDIEDLIDDEDIVVTMSAAGYVKAVAIDEFRTQARGGRGVSGANLKDQDVVVHMLQTTAHAYLLFFSNRGRVYRLKAHEIPMVARTARGTAIVNLLQLQPGETIQAIIDTRDYESYRYLFFCTRNGQVKKTKFTDYDSSLRAGLIAINLKEGDELVEVKPSNGDDDILIVSRRGQTIRFDENDVRPMGRTAAGVRGMRLREGDEVVSFAVRRTGGDGARLLYVTDNGFGKRTDVDQFRVKGRGGLGMRGVRITEDRGEVVAAFMVADDDEIVIVAAGGVLIRMAVSDVSIQGRDATGVRLMSLGADQQVAAVARVIPHAEMGLVEGEADGDGDGDGDGEEQRPPPDDQT